jgi:hypothetical protein
MNVRLARQVRHRAGNRCEYCRIPQSGEIIPHQVEHVIARKHGGLTTSNNLAQACISCNGHKGPNIAGIDPVTGKLSRLFHPRQDQWRRHFEMGADGLIAGKTSVGRTTVEVLCMNETVSVSLRAALIDEGAISIVG